MSDTLEYVVKWSAKRRRYWAACLCPTCGTSRSSGWYSDVRRCLRVSTNRIHKHGKSLHKLLALVAVFMLACGQDCPVQSEKGRPTPACINERVDGCCFISVETKRVECCVDLPELEYWAGSTEANGKEYDLLMKAWTSDLSTRPNLCVGGKTL